MGGNDKHNLDEFVLEIDGDGKKLTQYFYASFSEFFF